jgi:hypothetical protein
MHGYHHIIQVLSRLIGENMKGRSVLTSKIESEIDLLERHVAMLKAIMGH